jgi:hypothetical protein
MKVAKNRGRKVQMQDLRQECMVSSRNSRKNIRAEQISCGRVVKRKLLG